MQRGHLPFNSGGKVKIAMENSYRWSFDSIHPSREGKYDLIYFPESHPDNSWR